MTVRMTRAEIGNAVFGCLIQGAPTIDEGTAAAGLSLAQWRTGLQYIRDVLSHNPLAVSYDASSRTYHFDVAEVEFYIAHNIRLFAMRLELLYDGQFVPEELKMSSPRLDSYRELDGMVQNLVGELQSSYPPVRIRP